MPIKDNTTYVTQFLANNNQPIPVTIYTVIVTKASKTCIIINEDIFFEISHKNKEYMFDYLSEFWRNIFQIHISYNEFDYKNLLKIEQKFIYHMGSIKELKNKMKEI